MGITASTGIFSGLEIGRIIDQLMAVERRPIDLLLKKKVAYESKISLYGNISNSLLSLKNTLSSLKKTSLLSATASSSDNTVFTASALSSASEGTYNIKVNNIAASQSIYSQAFASDGDAVADLSVNNTQKMRIQVGGNEPVDITIDSTNNTLNSIKDAINNANAGVKASVINDDSGYRLAISVNSTGASNRIKIMIDEDNNGQFEEAHETDNLGLSRLAFNPIYNQNGETTGGINNMTQGQAGIDASVTIDGINITRPKNSIDDLIPGVTINLLKDSSGNTLRLTVSRDASRIINSVNAFVNSYKSVIELSKKANEGALNADNSVRTIIEGLRAAITTSYNGNTPLQFGISHDKYGVLFVNTARLENAIKEDPQSVVNTLDAMANDLEAKINTYINSLIPSRTNGAKDSIRFLENRIEGIERVIDKKEIEYRKRFASLEKLIGQLQQSSNYITQISNLSKIYGGNK